MERSLSLVAYEDSDNENGDENRDSTNIPNLAIEEEHESLGLSGLVAYEEDESEKENSEVDAPRNSSDEEEIMVDANGTKLGKIKKNY
eukprot:TRINITY_DN2173_c0_g1_i3.p1 TRINITY_DN2173_c0_g1~~TRINITY_DN2173_c0_g1_i3.p1  ORF type:complete len:103 (-),score=33.19 TRINITY_DN2173_c0_g1_i3:23-286(-)